MYFYKNSVFFLLYAENRYISLILLLDWLPCKKVQKEWSEDATEEKNKRRESQEEKRRVVSRLLGGKRWEAVPENERRVNKRSNEGSERRNDPEKEWWLRERGMQGIGECEESERRRREDKRGIVLCGSPQLRFSLVAITTGRERTDKLTRWLETQRRRRACVSVCRRVWLSMQSCSSGVSGLFRVSGDDGSRLTFVSTPNSYFNFFMVPQQSRRTVISCKNK